MRAISGGARKPVGRSPTARPVAGSTGVGEWVEWLMLFRSTIVPARTTNVKRYGLSSVVRVTDRLLSRAEAAERAP